MDYVQTIFALITVATLINKELKRVVYKLSANSENVHHKFSHNVTDKITQTRGSKHMLFRMWIPPPMSIDNPVAPFLDF